MHAPPDQTVFWNDAARTRQFTHPLDHAGLTARVSPTTAILDYGCGQGRLSAELLHIGYSQVLGMDSSPEMIRLARERCPQARFEVIDGATLPCADASIGAVLLFAVLTCIPDDVAQKNLLAEFKRILVPGGLLLLSDYPLQADARNVERYQRFSDELGGYGRFRIADGAVLRHHRREWFGQLLAGFTVEHEAEIDGLTMNGNPARILQLWARKER